MNETEIDTAINEMVVDVFQRITTKIAGEAMEQVSCCVGETYIKLINDYIMSN